jgi:hypothetical protein
LMRVVHYGCGRSNSATRWAHVQYVLMRTNDMRTDGRTNDMRPRG